MSETDVNHESLMFLQLVSTYQMLAMTHMGKITDPQSGEVHRNLEMARQSIDLLAMLQRKTAGNLTDEEGRYLQQVLTDLRMNYVDEQHADRGQPATEGPDAESGALDDAPGDFDAGEADASTGDSAGK